MRHTDNGILQDQVSCLQVTRDNGKTWVRVPFVPGALVINLGDIGHLGGASPEVAFSASLAALYGPPVKRVYTVLGWLVGGSNLQLFFPNDGIAGSEPSSCCRCRNRVFQGLRAPFSPVARGKLPPKQQDKPSTNADIASDDVSLSKPSPTLPLSEPDTSFKASVTTAGESVISIATSKSQAAFISTPEVIEFISPSAAVSHADHFVNQSAIAKYNLKVWFSYQKLV
ncbi:hypothetical protein F2Q70_00026845 [Brassica cretica]|uniref:Isopenicillin N synthase-like Fe(2+) 2OG dioxygenase domain-containing protein n=1 Tax=Brassica cretica TaxID=69181 RepID=A0A8S9LAQ7_BRACR|nr:hypothetical protein F2Q70_00026845 [Brassica cretica]